MASIQILIEDQENLNNNRVSKNNFQISNELAYTLISELKSRQFGDSHTLDRTNTWQSEFLLKEFIFASSVMIIAGVIYLILSWLGVTFAFDILTVAIGLFVGIAIKSVFDFYRRSITPEDVIYSLKKDGLGSYLSFRLPTLYSQKWLQIEKTLRHLSVQVFDESNEYVPLSLLMRKLGQENILSAEDSKKIYDLLKIRNQIVYGTSNIRKSDLQNALIEADQVHAKIKAKTSTT